MPPTDPSNLSLVSYMTEYAPFSPESKNQRREVPGNNFLFERALLKPAEYSESFEKTFFVMRLREDGISVKYLDGLRVSYLKCYGRLSYVRRRFAHGQMYAIGRVRTEGRSSRPMAVFMPIMPLLRMFRNARNLQGVMRISYAKHLISIALAEVAWTAGEFWGYLSLRKPVAFLD